MPHAEIATAEPLRGNYHVVWAPPRLLKVMKERLPDGTEAEYRQELKLDSLDFSYMRDDPARHFYEEYDRNPE